MVFSVVVRVLDVFRITHIIAGPIVFLLAPLGISRDLVYALISGFFEITIGTEMASRAAAPVVQRAVAASAIIAWSGLSVFAQAASMLFGTDVRMGVYFMARVLHAVLAALVGLALVSCGPWAARQALTAMPGALATSSFLAVMGRSCIYLTSIIGVLAIGQLWPHSQQRPKWWFSGQNEIAASRITLSSFEFIDALQRQRTSDPACPGVKTGWTRHTRPRRFVSRTLHGAPAPESLPLPPWRAP